MSNPNLLEEIADLCLEAANNKLIPKKIILGQRKMAEAYTLLIQGQNTKSVFKDEGERFTLEDFKKHGCQLNLGYGAMTVEYKDGDPDFIQLKSLTEDQLQKQAERDALRYISEENKLKNQGRDK